MASTANSAIARTSDASVRRASTGFASTSHSRFHLISRFRDDARLYYLYEVERTGKRGRPRIIDGKIDYKHLDKGRMQSLTGEEVLDFYRTRFQIEFCFIMRNSQWRAIVT